MGNAISFSVSEKEQYREHLASLAKLDLDPRGRGDAIMIIVFLIIYGLDLFVVLFLLWNRKYPPLKSKNPLIMSLVMVCAWIWFTSELAANGHVPLAGTIMTNCKAFGVWLRILLGVCSVSCLIALRTYGLYRVFHLNMPYQGLSFYLPFLFYFICIIIYGIVSQLISPRLTIEYVAVLDICNYNSGFKASVFTLLWVTWIFVVFLSWKIRNIKSSFNESTEITLASFIVFAVLAFTTIMHYTHPRFALDVQLRVATTTLDHIAVNVLWWLIMAKPLYMCLFHRNEYMREWLHKLRQDGLQRAYDVDSRGTSGVAALGSYNARVSMLMNNIRSSHDVGFFYAMDGSSSVQDHDSKSESLKHQRLSLTAPLEDPVAKLKQAYNQDTLPISGTDLSHREDIVLSSFNGSHSSIGRPASSTALNPGDTPPPPRARPVSPRLVPESRKVYKRISFPDSAHIAPLSLTDAQRRNLDAYDSEGRNII
ncbi:hypothetical protein J3B02_000828 [Coemansia erecta]|uniref:G-protein coupled receptors family 3 profile domain-containing protein n=1 Tax=Coemansia asiatica TaxID=1052880 RepID=A0A9W7XHZ3_9FUNG|nr:hypothetical protein LPJ64_003394 [Coemansia asiatica]KAJ2857700.1 hypothetical protein J3B02_000828 [Coemansia erecta]KAJ2888320.1 hypothetical protein FB639_000713 [Coemansia asiatica]